MNNSLIVIPAKAGIQSPLAKHFGFTKKVCSVLPESWWNLDTRLRGYDGLEWFYKKYDMKEF